MTIIHDISGLLDRPRRLRLGPLLDIALIADPAHIEWLNDRTEVERALDPKASWLHRALVTRTVGDLSFDGATLPVFLSRRDTTRAANQKRLAARLDAAGAALGPDTQQITRFVRGDHTPAEVGVAVQHWCGRLFAPNYQNDQARYEAGRLLAEWPSAPPWQTLPARIFKRLARAKARVAQPANGDTSYVHGTSIGMENVARSARNLRMAATRKADRSRPVEEILHRCLAAPKAVLRGVTRDFDAPFFARPLTKKTVIVFLLGHALQKSPDLNIAFLGDSWSECPARYAITDMLRAVWQDAIEQPDHSASRVRAFTFPDRSVS